MCWSFTNEILLTLKFINIDSIQSLLNSLAVVSVGFPLFKLLQTTAPVVHLHVLSVCRWIKKFPDMWTCI
jgi:hypothetical protein